MSLAATASQPHPWERPLRTDKHGRRRSLLTGMLRRCGTHAPAPPVRQRLERAIAVRRARESAFAPAGGGDQQGGGGGGGGGGVRTIEVPTYVTIVLREDGRGSAPDPSTLVSDAAVHAQLDALNKAYGSTPGSPVRWTFALKALSRVKGGGDMCDQKAEARLKGERRRGGPGALNLYFADLSECGLLGFSSWPWDMAAKGEAADGVVIHYDTLPGGTYKPYNRGFTTIHETGHWYGLYHTFQNGCTGAGDSVEDTPFVATPTEGCPKARDTCSQPGGDPVANPMDYTDDACMEGFSVVSRMMCFSLVFCSLMFGRRRPCLLLARHSRHPPARPRSHRCLLFANHRKHPQGQQQRMESLYRMYRGFKEPPAGGGS